MNNNVYEIDFTRNLPPPLKNDSKMLALGKTIAAELQKTIQLSKQAVIYARIDELDETVLDILAYDLHVDWYNFGYTVEAKRAIIKDSVRVHKRLGTKFAVETALGNLAPKNKVEEWFEYGGEAYHFRVVIDTTDSRIIVTVRDVIDAVKFYKRLSAHLDEVIYQSVITLGIGVATSAFRFNSGMTGKVDCGTLPQINTIGKLDNKGIYQAVSAESFKFDVKRCGTSLCKS